MRICRTGVPWFKMISKIGQYFSCCRSNDVEMKPSREDAGMEMTTGSSTTILDLNDDCLHEVFDCLKLRELTAVADVCTRFRQNAMRSARSKCKDILLTALSSVHQYSKLRNFGAFIESVSVRGCCYSKSRKKLQKRLIKLVDRYCVGAFIEMKIFDYDITDENARRMMPLLARAQKLQFSGCKWSKTILKNLSLWSPQLRELKFLQYNDRDEDSMMHFDIFRLNFPKLESISFWWNSHAENIKIEEFLKLNPQLTQIELFSGDTLDASIFHWIFKYVPGIERISFGANSVVNRNSIKYFGQLRALKSLTIHVSPDHSYHLCMQVLNEIASANIGLEFLGLAGFDLRNNTQRFIEGILKFQTLKTLQLMHVRKLTTLHLIEICKQLKDLSEIQLFGIDLGLTEENLLQLIQNAEKLQKFEYVTLGMAMGCGQTIIVDSTFKKLVEIVGQRRGKMKLNLLLGMRALTAKRSMKLTVASNNLLTVQTLMN